VAIGPQQAKRSRIGSEGRYANRTHRESVWQRSMPGVPNHRADHPKAKQAREAEPAATPAPSSTRNIAALMPSTAHNTRL
jgi:hypothetical protein